MTKIPQRVLGEALLISALEYPSKTAIIVKSQEYSYSSLRESSENLARYLFRALSKRLNSRRVKVHRVWVSESPGTSATYWETA